MARQFDCSHQSVSRVEAIVARPDINATDKPVDGHSRSISPDSAFLRAGCSEFLRTRNNNPSLVETRGRKPLLGITDCQAIESLYKDHGYEARTMSWEAQAHNALDIDVSGQTIRRAMRLHLNYSKYVAAEKGFVKPEVANARMAFARKMLDQWDLDDWRRVRFSDETHFGWVLSKSKLPRSYVSRQPGQREDIDCVAERPPPADTVKEHRVHCWAAVGHNFKSPLVRYYSQNPVSIVDPLTASTTTNLL